MLLKVQVFQDGGRWWAAGLGPAAFAFACAETLDALMAEIEREAWRHFREELDEGERIELLVLYEKTLRRAEPAADAEAGADADGKAKPVRKKAKGKPAESAEPVAESETERAPAPKTRRADPHADDDGRRLERPEMFLPEIVRGLRLRRKPGKRADRDSDRDRDAQPNGHADGRPPTGGPGDDR